MTSCRHVPWVLLVLALAPSRTSAEWIPAGTLYPRLAADPREPRIGLTLTRELDPVDGALGGPVPILRVRAGSLPLQFNIEALVLTRLGRDAAYFPLQTVDGLFGLGIEADHSRWMVRLKLMHQSGHLADGSPQIEIPPVTFSRETASLDLGYGLRQAVVYARIGTPWHTAPEVDAGLELGLGFQGEVGTGQARPFLAAHFEAESEHNWRVRQSILAGWLIGRERQVLIGLRYQNGYRVHGQFWSATESLIGLELQYAPLAKFLQDP